MKLIKNKQQKDLKEKSLIINFKMNLKLILINIK